MKHDVTLQRALALVELDEDGRCTNANAVRAALVSEFGISKSRAAAIEARAARRKRHPTWGAPKGGQPGAGRPTVLDEPVRRATITLLESHEKFLREIDPNLSQAIRKLIEQSKIGY